MTYWKHPPISKIYEALGAVADGRVAIAGTGAKVKSSSGNKAYDVEYDAAAQAITSNDNGSYFQGYLGYPSIALLMLLGEISYDPAVAAKLRGVAWKDVNTKFKNDFDAAVMHVLDQKSQAERDAIESEAVRIDEMLRKRPYAVLHKRARPPEGY